MSTDTDYKTEAPGVTNGYGTPTAERGAKKTPRTRRQKIEDGLERVELAVAELVLAVDTATKFDVPGFDLGATLASDLGPVLGKIGYQIKALPKAKRA